jgi:CubicO group peptidase (beta-lactamase class C family)
MGWNKAFAVSAALALGCAATSARALDMKPVAPEAAGFSAERLQRLDAAMAGLVRDRQFAGMVTVLSRHGQIVEVRAYGDRNIERNAPMQPDTIVWCASMTKPVTAVAMMILYEEGKWRPEDPIAKFIPEFANLKVFAGFDKDGKPILEAPVHPPTMGELMSQTAGFTYGIMAQVNPVDKMYADADLRASPTLQVFIDRLAKLPLLYQPGSRWVYSFSVDIQGYLVEKLSGQSLPDFARQRIFTPLGMTDTDFYVPAAKLDRLATAYRRDPATGALVAAPRQPVQPDPSRIPSMPSGGGGLYSTALDYVRFAQMLASGGALDGVRILAPSSVALMSANHLSDRLAANGQFGLPARSNDFVLPDGVTNTDAFGVAFYRVRPGIGYGYDVGVIYDPLKAGRTVGAGTIHWDGAYGTWFWSDPTNDIAFVGMVQHADLLQMPNVQELARTLTYQALVDPKK